MFFLGFLTYTNEAQVEAACLIPQAAFIFGFQIMGIYETGGAGVQFSNWYQGREINGVAPFSAVCSMLLFDTFFWALIAWYFEQAN